MLIAEKKLRKIIRQELIKEENSAFRTGLIATCFAALAMVSSACNVNDSYTGKSHMPPQQCLSELNKLINQKKIPPTHVGKARRAGKALQKSLRQESDFGISIAGRACEMLVNHYGK